MDVSCLRLFGELLPAATCEECVERALSKLMCVEILPFTLEIRAQCNSREREEPHPFTWLHSKETYFFGMVFLAL